MRIFLIMMGISFCTYIAEGADKFFSPTAGIGLTKPANWEFITAQDYADNIRAGSDLIGSDTSSGNLPVVAASSPLGTYDLATDIRFTVTDIGHDANKYVDKIFQAVLKELQRVDPNSELREYGNNYTLAGRKAWHFDILYTLKPNPFKSLRLVNKQWFIPKGTQIVIFSVTGPQKDEAKYKEVVNKVISSLVIK